MPSEELTTISPTTNQPVLKRKTLGDAELEALPKKAAEAFKTWSKTSLENRQQIIAKALELMRSRQDELAKELTEQMGRPISYVAKEITTAAARGEYMLKVSTDALKDTEGEPESGFKRYIKKVPLGPVLTIFAWNYPYLILVNSLIPALLAGNTVILKPSPQTPTVAEQAKKLLAEAGIPDDVVQVFHEGQFKRIEKVIQAPEIRLVCFTGSVSGGLAVRKAASDRIAVHVGLELGGKDPAYIRSDVDVNWAAEEIVDGAVFNSGQSCCSLERIYVDKKVHDQFVTAVQNELKGYKLGDPFDRSTNVGPVVSQHAARKIESQVQDAIGKGAEDVTPVNDTFKSPPKNGNYVAPRLLINCNHEMDIMMEETFGPIIPVMKVANDAEAVRLMNDSQYGLTASIWTKDVAKGHEIAQDIDAGTVFVNRADFPSPDLAWTGWKESGNGHTLSKLGFDQFVKLKSMHIKDYPK